MRAHPKQVSVNFLTWLKRELFCFTYSDFDILPVEPPLTPHLRRTKKVVRPERRRYRGFPLLHIFTITI